MIKATMTGGEDETPRSTFTMGSTPCASCGSRKAHEHLPSGQFQSQRSATGWDDTPPPRPQRMWSSIKGIDTSSGPWYESYGNGGSGPSPSTLAAQAEARRQTVEAQDEWHARKAAKGL